ncbi:MAG: helix-turn-helix transcriptional regulator [Chthoniobacterales bacterium]|nr:helix-turn-helix transcriptional regulator [Chthoniobacterales bacterium]
MNRKRPKSVSEVTKPAPPLLRSLPCYHFDSAADGEQKGPQVARTFKMRGRVRNVLAKLTLPQGVLVAAAVAGESSFDLEIDREIFMCRFSIDGHTRYESEGQTLCDEAHLLLCPGAHVHAAVQDAAILLVAMKQSAVARALGADCAPPVGVKALGRKHGAHLRELAFAAAHEAEQTAGDLRAVFLRNFQNMFACALGAALMEFAPGFRRPDPMIGRRKVSELRDWATLDHPEPVTVGDLAARCGLGLRALQKNFLLHFDTAPLAYLRDLRLQKARRLLQQENTRHSVTSAALEAGFAHLGRFAADYRRKFGESPCETRRTSAAFGEEKGESPGDRHE